MTWLVLSLLIYSVHENKTSSSYAKNLCHHQLRVAHSNLETDSISCVAYEHDLRGMKCISDMMLCTNQRHRIDICQRSMNHSNQQDQRLPSPTRSCRLYRCVIVARPSHPNSRCPVCSLDAPTHRYELTMNIIGAVAVLVCCCLWVSEWATLLSFIDRVGSATAGRAVGSWRLVSGFE